MRQNFLTPGASIFVKQFAPRRHARVFWPASYEGLHADPWWMQRTAFASAVKEHASKSKQQTHKPINLTLHPFLYRHYVRPSLQTKDATRASPSSITSSSHAVSLNIIRKTNTTEDNSSSRKNTWPVPNFKVLVLINMNARGAQIFKKPPHN